MKNLPENQFIGSQLEKETGFSVFILRVFFLYDGTLQDCSNK